MTTRDNQSGNIHLLYKNLGETPFEAILSFKKDNWEYRDVAMTYAGRLDPMAEGLLLVLSGREALNKDKYLDLQKTYETEILWGFETDTLDVLGKVLQQVSQGYSSEVPSQDIFDNNYLKKHIGKFEQKYPFYSSKPVNGVPLFQLAREGKLDGIEIPSHEVEIFDIGYLSRRIITTEKLSEEITFKISLVSGDFRQKEILSKWQKVLEDKKETQFILDKITLTVSSGFYVRQFVFDLAKSLNTSALTFHIKRTKIGEFAGS